eukprot:CAMPEP_0116872776 /NCGR_PEP_ID=MMETSP0463-20121206/3634_1 /TAXON_ID=181622 /ORGANISM="Strombidinopsis sp, Strain SopsisLIS2011" /LENGTH=37 /DNA_ID= /DNA_START= /DNA_END= /DNA_ORIENTATION=
MQQQYEDDDEDGEMEDDDEDIELDPDQHPEEYQEALR